MTTPFGFYAVYKFLLLYWKLALFTMILTESNYPGQQCAKAGMTVYEFSGMTIFVLDV